MKAKGVLAWMLGTAPAATQRKLLNSLNGRVAQSNRAAVS
jgi:hypothetical protein